VNDYYLDNLASSIRTRSTHTHDVGKSRMVQTEFSLLDLSINCEVIVALNLSQLILSLLKKYKKKALRYKKKGREGCRCFYEVK
jgi:hypothetical protein